MSRHHAPELVEQVTEMLLSGASHREVCERLRLDGRTVRTIAGYRRSEGRGRRKRPRPRRRRRKGEAALIDSKALP
jgi:hypothetical protein